MDIFDRWELMKFMIKQCALRHSINKARSERATLEALEKKLAHLEKLRDQGTLDQCGAVSIFVDHVDQINKIKDDIDQIYNKRTISARMRTRAQWYKCAERSSKYFFALEKHNYTKKTINRIMDTHGNIKSDPAEVHDVLNNYFDQLFSRKHDAPIDL